MGKLSTTLKTALSSKMSKDAAQFSSTCYEELSEKIYKIAYGYFSTEAEDITQDIFLKIFQLNIEKLEPHINYIDRYLLKIAKYHCITIYKGKKRRPQMSGDENSILVEASSNTKVDQEIDFLKCIHSIPKRQGIAISKKLEGYNVKEIAESMGVSEGAAKNLIYRGKQNIKKYFTSE